MRELTGLSLWTELCELHDWDEEEAAKTLNRYMLSLSPIPVGRVREICESLHVLSIKLKDAPVLDKTETS